MEANRGVEQRIGSKRNREKGRGTEECGRGARRLLHCGFLHLAILGRNGVGLVKEGREREKDKVKNKNDEPSAVRTSVDFGP